MRVGVLGPVEVTIDRVTVPLEAPKERAIVCVLALHPDQTVPVGTLVDALWGDDPPVTADRTLSSHVSRLRGRIGPDRIVGDPSGYRLVIDPTDVDAQRLDDLVTACSAALEIGDARRAAQLAGTALAVWRGEPLTDLADGHVRAGEQARLDELLLRAHVQRVDAELRLGHHERLVGELQQLVETHPLHEPLWQHLMVALYRSGRQADALRAYERLRRRLESELGVAPMPGVTHTEHLILAQDPRLDLDPPPPPGNLPVPSDSFIGRIDELRDITERVREHRLVTVTGPGGVGKTRLALRVAEQLVDEFPDGTWWVDLASVRDPAAVAAAASAALDVATGPGRTIEGSVLAHLRHRRLLLVVDNCEHLAAPVAHLIQRMLEGAPEAHVLATARRPLGTPGEHRIVVPPLSTPRRDGGPPDVRHFDAIRLFVDRAADAGLEIADADLTAVGDICRHVDGMPLAIELVASRMSYLAPSELAARLPDAIPLGEHQTGLGDPRYDSLLSAVEWSHALLEPAEQALLAILSIVPTSFDVDLVEALGAELGDRQQVVDQFGRLVDASFVQPTGSNGVRRFRLLFLIRAFAADRLAADDAASARRRFVDHFRRLAHDHGLHQSASDDTAVLDWLRREAVNLRTAIEWSLECDEPASSIQFGPALGRSCLGAEDPVAAAALLEKLLDAAGEADPRSRAWSYYWLAWPRLLQNELVRASEALDRAGELAEAIDDRDLCTAVHTARGHALLLGLGDIDGAVPHYERAIAPPSNPSMEYDAAELSLAQALVLGDRTEGLADLLDRVQTRLESDGNERLLGQLFMDRALLAWSVGDMESIVPLAEAGVRHARAANSQAWEQINLTSLGVGHLEAGSLDDADGALLRAARMALDVDNRLQLGIAVQAIAAVAARQGRTVDAARLHGAGTRLAPAWPLMQRRLSPHLQPARDALGDRFDVEVESGRALEPAEVVSLALGGPT